MAEWDHITSMGLMEYLRDDFSYPDPYEILTYTESCLVADHNDEDVSFEVWALREDALWLSWQSYNADRWELTHRFLREYWSIQ